MHSFCRDDFFEDGNIDLFHFFQIINDARYMAIAREFRSIHGLCCINTSDFDEHVIYFGDRAIWRTRGCAIYNGKIWAVTGWRPG